MPVTDSHFQRALTHVSCTTEILEGERSTINWNLANFNINHDFYLNLLAETTLNIGPGHTRNEVAFRFSFREYMEFLPAPNTGGNRWFSLWVSAPPELNQNVCLQVHALPIINSVPGEASLTNIALTPGNTFKEIRMKFLHVSTWNYNTNGWSPVADGLANSVGIKLDVTNFYSHDEVEIATEGIQNMQIGSSNQEENI